jgi:predicted thioredoxin/glutaredoxin
VRKAIDSVAALGDDTLTHDAEHGFGAFQDKLSAQTFFDALIARHEQVQATKGKLSWLDQIDGDWTVRSPYRNQTEELNDEFWAHPMRLVTLASLLAKTE